MGRQVGKQAGRQAGRQAHRWEGRYGGEQERSVRYYHSLHHAGTFYSRIFYYAHQATLSVCVTKGRAVDTSQLHYTGLELTISHAK